MKWFKSLFRKQSISKIELRAVDFKDARFSHSKQCAITNALRRAYQGCTCSEYVDYCFFKPSADEPLKRIEHEPYNRAMFETDSIRANNTGFDNTVIRTIKITKVQRYEVF